MDMETSFTAQDQLPSVRRVNDLNKIPKILPARSLLKDQQQFSYPVQKKNHLGVILICIFFLVLVFELTIIYRYDKLNKQYYLSYIAQKEKLTDTQKKLLSVTDLKNQTDKENADLTEKYAVLDSKYSDLDATNKMLNSDYDLLKRILNNYKYNYNIISSDKLSKIYKLSGDVRVLNARIEAVNIQNEVLNKEVKLRDDYIKELTNKLVDNINEQGRLVEENVMLKRENRELSRIETNEKPAILSNKTEKTNVNKRERKN